MSVLSIAAYFPFCRVKLTRQSVAVEADMAWVEAEPDLRYRPVCHACGGAGARVHDWGKRSLRDLNLGAAQVWIGCSFRKIYCPACGKVRVEDLEFFDPYKRVTQRLARYIHELCKVLTVKEVAEHLRLDWKTVKDIDQSFLERRYDKTDYSDLTLLAVDEIAIRKGHQYMTVVMDYLTGRVVWLGKDRTAETLMDFFDGMSDAQKQALQAIAMDMWAPYIAAVQAAVPHVQIVFDLFHVVAAFNQVIDKVRNDEYPLWLIGRMCREEVREGYIRRSLNVARCHGGIACGKGSKVRITDAAEVDLFSFSRWGGDMIPIPVGRVIGAM